LDFVSIMANCSIREAALMIHDWLVPPTVSSTTTNRREVKAIASSEANTSAHIVKPNKPLMFTLKGIDHAHPYLRHRGITEETVRAFGVGFFRGRGSMSGRIVIPIHNYRGELVAYAGRSIDATGPKYKLPAGFAKSVELFNLHRVLALPVESRGSVVVCEGFFDCMKVYQAGFPVVGLMGSSLSDAQEVVLRHFGRVILLLDADKAGREAAETIASRLVHSRLVRVIDLPCGRQPDQLSSDEIAAILGFL
jgi:DNA primase